MFCSSEMRHQLEVILIPSFSLHHFISPEIPFFLVKRRGGGSLLRFPLRHFFPLWTRPPDTRRALANMYCTLTHTCTSVDSQTHKYTSRHTSRGSFQLGQVSCLCVVVRKRNLSSVKTLANYRIQAVLHTHTHSHGSKVFKGKRTCPAL